MQYRRFLACVSFPILFIIGCGSDSESPSTKAIVSDTSSISTLKYKTALQVEPLLANTDSVQMLFYSNPDGDSLRYTRFFSHISSKDAEFIRLLVQQAAEVAEERNEVRDCRSEGKIYLFSKGEPVKTIYFSTLADKCSFLYLIKNGYFYYLPLSEPLKSALLKNKESAKKEG